jgi:choline dehydrogenase-like flavoprotein
MSAQYDAIIIGTGAGGGTLAFHLAQAGKNILILERGSFMPQEKLNWDTSAVFIDNRYHTKETWLDKDGKELHPQQSYFVGGQTKVFGAAMFRMRAEDFGVIHHKGGISPAWPLSYSDLEPYYTRARGPRNGACSGWRFRLFLRSHRALSFQKVSLPFSRQ